MRKVYIEHITKYSYSSAVRYHANQIMLYPISSKFQKINSHVLEISTAPQITMHQDFFGNTIGTFNIINHHSEMIVKSILDVTISSLPIPINEEAPKTQWQSVAELKGDVSFFEYLQQSEEFYFSEIESILPKNYIDMSPLDVCIHLSEYVYKGFTYKKGITNVDTSLSEVWELKAGVCQDFTTFLLYLNRLIGIPSRYVSGYICPKENSNFRGVGATHAWVEAYIPKLGWIGIDPTNNCLISDNHVKLSVGRHYKDCSPLKGVYSGDSNDQLMVSVKINDKKYFNNSESEEMLPANNTNAQEIITNSFAKHQEILIQQQQQQQQQ